MASVEIIGVLYAGSNVFHESKGCSNSESLSRAELAGLLAGLTPVQTDLALAKYGLDVGAERKLIAHVRMWAVNLAIAEQWQVVKGRPTVVNMAAISVFEVVRPNCCVRCRGVGFKSGRICTSCGGARFKSLSGHKIGNAIGVSHSDYLRTWQGRYKRIYDYVSGINQDVIWSTDRSDKKNVCTA